MSDDEQTLPADTAEQQEADSSDVKPGDDDFQQTSEEKTDDNAEKETESDEVASKDPFLFLPLFDAIRDQKLDEIKKLIPDSDLTLRDCYGRTYLHYALAIRSSPEIYATLLAVSDLSRRDEEGKSVADIALEDQDYNEALLVQIDNQVHQLLMTGDVEKFEDQVLSGLEVPRPASAKRTEIKSKSEGMDNLLEQLQGFEERISQLHGAIHQGDLDTVKQCLEKKKLGRACDVTGMAPLHKAAIFQNLPVLQYLAESFPVLIDDQDFMGRTALHYAALSDNDDLYQILLESGAGEEIKDLKGRTPLYYKDHKDILLLTDVQGAILEKTAQIRKTLRSRPTSAERRENAGVQSERDIHSVSSHHQSSIMPTYDPKKDPFLVEKAPPPKTPDTMYVAENLGEPLTLALAEIADKRPWDPIEFLSQWLIHYSQQTKYQAKMKEENDRLESEREVAMIQDDRQVKCQEEKGGMMKEEEMKAKEEEEKRRQKELEEKRAQQSNLSPPDLPTVAEESEAEPETARVESKPGSRDIKGRTPLHLAAMTEDSNLLELLEGGDDVTSRDIDGKTAYQLANEAQLQGNEEAIEAHVSRMFQLNDVEKVNWLIMNEYQPMTDVDELAGRDDVNIEDTVMEIWNKRTETQQQITTLRESLDSGDIDTFKSSLVDPSHLRSRDQHGRTLLHSAVLHILADVVSLILEKDPEIVNLVDNYDRTALHYAAAVDGSIYTLLRAANTDEALADIHGNMSSFYADDRSAIFNDVEGLEDLVTVHISKLASEIVDTADSIEKRASDITDQDVDGPGAEVAAEGTTEEAATEEATVSGETEQTEGTGTTEEQTDQGTPEQTVEGTEEVTEEGTEVETVPEVEETPEDGADEQQEAS